MQEQRYRDGFEPLGLGPGWGLCFRRLRQSSIEVVARGWKEGGGVVVGHHSPSIAIGSGHGHGLGKTVKNCSC